jgi:histidinol-phosphate aminotransferase
MGSIPLRKNILNLQPYVPGKPIEDVKRELGLDRVIKLASNENPLGPSPKAIQAIQNYASSVHLYPDGNAADLRMALAEKYQVGSEQIVVGNGSEDLIALLGTVLLGNPDDEVISPHPSFPRYITAAELAPSTLIKVPLNLEMKVDLDMVAAKITPKTKIIFLANPNNPTGTVFLKNQFDEFLAEVPPNVVVVLDEAYHEFAVGTADVPDGVQYAISHPNVVVLRTLSKAYGLAGIRVGFGVVSQELSEAIHRARAPFNVSSIAQVAGIAALHDEGHVQKTVALNTLGRERLNEFLAKKGAQVFDSRANFSFANLGRPAIEIFGALLRRGVITRPGDAQTLPNCLRVSIGTPAEMQIFEKEFAEAF